MALMIVVIILMKNFAIMIVRKINLNAVAMADVFWAPGNAMATRIVLMAPTKIRIFVVSYLHFDFASILVLKKLFRPKNPQNFLLPLRVENNYRGKTVIKCRVDLNFY